MSNKIKSKDVGIMKNERSIANSIFSKEKNINEIYLYGSRVKNNYRKESDYDFGISVNDKENDSEMLLIRLKEEFTESNFPYLVSFVLDNKHQSKEDNFSKEYNKEKKLFYKRHKNKDNKDNVKENKKEKLTKGYGLHVRRLGYVRSDSAIRSFKIPLESVLLDKLPVQKNKKEINKDRYVKSRNEYYKTFSENIRQDYINQVGNFNLTDYLADKDNEENEKTYSIFDFYLDCLRCGVVFVHKNAQIKILLAELTNNYNQKEKLKDWVDKNYKDVAVYISIEGLFQRCVSGIRKANDNEARIKKIREGIIKREYLDKDNNNNFYKDIENDFYIDKEKQNKLNILIQDFLEKIFYEMSLFEESINEKYSSIKDYIKIKDLYGICVNKEKRGKDKIEDKRIKKLYDKIVIKLDENKIIPDNIKNEINLFVKNLDNAFIDENSDEKVNELFYDNFINIDDEDDGENVSNSNVKDYFGFSFIPEIEWNYTFYILHNFEFSKNMSAKNLLARYKKYLIDNKNVYYGFKEEDRLKLILGLYNNHGAFANFFNDTIKENKNGDKKSGILNIIQNNPDEILKTITNIVISNKNTKIDIWENNKEELKNRINFLSDQSKRLGKPNFVNGWHDYRSSFGGKIESWVSNSLNQEQEIKNQLFGYNKKTWDKKNKAEKEEFVNGHIQILEKIKTDKIYIDIKQKDKIENNIISLPDIIINKVNELIKLNNDLNEDKGGFLNDNLLNFYRQALGDIRTELNIFYQDIYPELDGKNEKQKKDDAKNKRANDKYEEIFKDIKLIPNFPGDSKGMVYDKYTKLSLILKNGITFIEDINNQIKNKEILLESERWRHNANKKETFCTNDGCKDNEQEIICEGKFIDYTLKTLQTLLNKYKDKDNDKIIVTELFENILKNIFNSELFTWKDSNKKSISGDDILSKSVKFSSKEKPYIIFKNKYAKDKRETDWLNSEIDSIDKAKKALLMIIKELSIDWNQHVKGMLINKENKKEEDIRKEYFEKLIECVEIEKIKLGILFTLYNYEYSINKDILSIENTFESAISYLERYNKENPNNQNKLSGSKLSTFIQAGILSEIKGAVNRLSRDSFTERYIVQPISSEKNYPIVKITEQITEKDKIKNKIKWGIIDKKNSIIKKELKKDDNKNDYYEVEIKNTKSFGENAFQKMFIKKDTNILYFNTSKYQLQFLTKYIENWWKDKAKISIASYSFIIENIIESKWDIGNYKLSSPIPVKQQLFVSVPFKMDAKESALPKIPKNGKGEGRTKIIGIDIGESGVAYTIIETKDNKVNNIIDSGFIYEPMVKAVRGYKKTIIAQQQKGTFAISNTKLERLRENAYTSIRNKIHNIAIRENAIPVYEREVSNFETGSSKVTAVYESIKRGDVSTKGNPAEEAERKLIWGNTNQFGNTIGAYATSYLCINCGYSPYTRFEEEKNKLEEEKNKLNNNKDEDKKRAKEINNEIDKLKIDLREEKNKSRPSNKDEKSNFVKERGNSAVYCCQNKDCEFNKQKIEIDADTQAAYWIALKGLIKIIKKDTKDDKSKTQSKIEQINEMWEYHNKDLFKDKNNLQKLKINYFCSSLC